MGDHNMTSPQSTPSRRGVSHISTWGALCKDCLRRESESDSRFAYPDAWVRSVTERGGSRSDRCPRCRQEHARDARSFAAPYVDIDSIGRVVNPTFPTGPLGGLGPLTVDHYLSETDSDLAEFDFGLDDAHILKLLEGLERRQVAVVVAGTGSGKSTFLPYRLLVPPDGARLRLADRGPIIVTQPRRAAATDIATFVATNLHKSHVGAGSDIGYRVKGEAAYDGSSRLIFVTDGSLINWLRDESYKRFGAIIVDEAHERSKNIDVILGILADALPRNPHLRLIIVSATINEQLFIDYYGGPEKVFHLPVEAKKLFGYGQPLWPIDEVDLSHWCEPNGQSKVYSQEGNPPVDLVEVTRRLVDLRTVTEPVEPGTWRMAMPAEVTKQVLAILRGTAEGDILAFLPSKRMIDAVVVEIIEALKTSDDPADAKVDVYPLLSTTPADVQRRARGEKVDPTRRRVVVSTNIAETSLTIDGMTFVVDSGLINQTAWDVETASKHVPAVPHSQDGVRQRWGRVGRKAPGWVFPLYTRRQYETVLQPHTPEEATRDDLESFYLTAKSAGVDDPDGFRWLSSFKQPDVPESEHDATLRARFARELGRSKAALQVRGALDLEGDVTPAGSELSAFSGSMSEAMALALGDRMACAVEVATALLAFKQKSFVQDIDSAARNAPAGQRLKLRRLRRALVAGCRDDLDVALKVFAAWERTSPDRRDEWASHHGLDPAKLARIHAGRLGTLEPLSIGKKTKEVRPIELGLADRVRGVLTRSLADQIYVRAGNRWRPIRTQGNSRLNWTLDRSAQTGGGDHVVAFGRRTSQEGGMVYLSGIVDCVESALDTDTTWLSLVAALAQQRESEKAGGHGSPVAGLADLLATWWIGEQFAGEIVLVDDGRLELRHARPFDASMLVVPQEDGLEDSSQAVSTDGPGANETGGSDGELMAVAAPDDEPVTELASEIADPEAMPIDIGDSIAIGLTTTVVVDTEALGATSADLEISEVASLTPMGVLDPTEEVWFVDVEEQERAYLDWDVEDGEPVSGDSASLTTIDAYQRSSTSNVPTTAGTPATAEIVPAPGFTLEAGNGHVKIVGQEAVDGRAVLRVVPFHPASENVPTDEGSAATQLPDRPITVIETVTGDGPSYIAAIDAQTGHDVVLGPTDLSLGGADLVPAITPGQVMSVTVTGRSSENGPFTADRHRQIHASLSHLTALGPIETTDFTATVVSAPTKNGSIVALETSADGSLDPLLLLVSKKALAEGGIVPVQGTALRVQLQLAESSVVDSSERAGMLLKQLPKGMPALQGISVQERGDQWLLESEIAMPFETRTTLRRLNKGQNWRRSINLLWRASHAIEVAKVTPFDGTILSDIFVEGESYPASITGFLKNDGVFVKFENDLTTRVLKGRIASGCLDPQRWLTMGQAVTVVVTGPVTFDQQGRLEIPARINSSPTSPIPPLGEQVRDELDRLGIPAAGDGPVRAVVTSLSDKGFGVAFGSLTSFVARDYAGIPLNVALGMVYRVGQEIDVLVKGDFTLKGQGRIELRVRVPDITPKARPRKTPEDHLAEVMTQLGGRNPVPAVVAMIGPKEDGVFVDIDGNLRTFVHRSWIGTQGVIDLTRYFAANTAVEVLITKAPHINPQNGRVMIPSAMPKPFGGAFPTILEQARAILQPGQVYSGRVTGTQRYGVFVGLPFRLSGLAAWNNVGRHRAPIPRSEMSEGRTVTVELAGPVSMDNKGKLLVPLTIVGLER